MKKAELESLVAAARQEVNNFHFDCGPFCVGLDEPDGKIFVESEDFTYDTRLYIDGDFGTRATKLLYAINIADRLNGDNPAPSRTLLINEGEEECKFYLDGALVAHVTHDLHGRDGMRAVHDALVALASVLHISIKRGELGQGLT